MRPGGAGFKIAAGGWLLFVAVLMGLALKQGPAFDSSLMALLPKSEQNPVLQHATEQMAERFSKRLILLLSGVDEGAVRSGIQALAGELSALPEVARVDWRVEPQAAQQISDALYPHRFSVLEEGIRQQLQAGAFNQVKERAVMQLYSPLAGGRQSLLEDPFGLFSTLSLHRYGGLDVRVAGQLLKVTGTDNASYMLMVTLAGEPFSPALQQRVLGVVEAGKRQLAQVGVTVDMSGMLVHAAAGARQAKAEMATIGIGSLVGILVIMCLIFRQFKPLLWMLFPVLIGCITAAAVTLLVFGRVHLVTFAFGAGLVGVSIDYALHFLCERRVTSSALILRKILPGLLLGLFSSVLAYAAQALAPFPGLRQMALFSVVGLAASWVTVVLWLPLLTAGGTQPPLAAARVLNRWRNRFPRLQESPILSGLLSVVLGFAVYSLWQSPTLDDIRLLQTSPASLLAQEQRVQKALGISSSSQFLLVSDATLEACLQKEEALVAGLESLKSSGLLNGYQAVSQALPSLQRQAENSALIQQLYEQQLLPYYGVLNVAEDRAQAARVAFDDLRELRLTPQRWMQQPASDSMQDLIVAQAPNHTATVIRLTGALNEQARAQLQVLSDTHDGVIYVDQVHNISELMGSYRSQIARWVLLAYLCVFLVLLIRYKTQVWRIILPPLLASVFTLACVAQLAQGINLFHLMALILVLGIGLDMGIFLLETGEAAHTWLAVSLSACTSLLAFGLLALSETPVLHHFGLTVLIGLSFVWLLAPVMRKHNSGDIHS